MKLIINSLEQWVLYAMYEEKLLYTTYAQV